MTKKMTIPLIMLLIFLGGVFVARFVLGGGEDTWICSNNRWVKHGNPKDPPPATGCGNDSQPTSAPKTGNFSKTGNIAKQGNTWNLVYEEPGSPALQASLSFNEDSLCNQKPCEMDLFVPGDRVKIDGNKEGNVISVLNMESVTSLTVKNAESDEDIIAGVTKAFADKYKRPETSFMLSVGEKDATHAKGSVRFKDEMDGGIWFAAKTSKGWELAFDGQGIMSCDSADKYNFSQVMVPGCIDTNNGNTFVER